MWMPNLFSAPSAHSAAKVGGRKSRRKTRGCNLKDSAVDFKKHTAQAGLTERKRGRRQKKTHPTTLTHFKNNHFNSKNCWISVGNELPKSTFMTQNGRRMGGKRRIHPFQEPDRNRSGEGQ